MLERQNLVPDEAENLTRIVLSQGLEARALQSRRTILKNRDEVDWYIDDVPDTHKIQSLISTPFYSQRSSLRGTVTYFHPKEDAFSQEHVQMFESIAIQTVAALENAWLLLQTATALSDTELLYRASRDFNSCQHIEELLAVLVDNFVSQEAQTRSGETVNHMSIGLITALEEDGAPKSIDLVASWNLQDPSIDNQVVGNTPNIKLISDQHPFVKQLSPDTIYNIRFDQPGVEAFMADHLGRARSAISIPLRVGNNWLGVLFIASCSNEFELKPNTTNQITALAGQAAVVIQNLQLVEETQQNLYNSEILSHLSQELLTADRPEAIYSLSLDAIAATDPSRGAAIFAYDKTERGVELEMVAIWDNPSQKWPAILPGARFSTADLGLQPLLRTGQTVVSSNIAKDSDFSETLRQLLYLMQIQSLVAVPIWLNKEVNGFILIGHKTTATFPSESIWLYENIGRLSSGALENHRLFEEAQYRATQLQTAAEISQVAASHLELDTLLTQSVNLIRDRFGFYHVSIFLVDEYQKYAVVEASTGEVGQQMLAMKHKLAVGGRSIVGTATGTAKPRIALDVGHDAVHFNNPLLPDTRSEMAMPLIARGQVIGALDVQSTNPNAFTESDITILQSMANQLANAIEAARSFQQANKALEDMGKLQERYLREEWSTFLKEQQAEAGYRLTEDGLMAINEPIQTSDEHRVLMNQAIEAKQPIIVPKGSSVNGSENQDSQSETQTPYSPDTSDLRDISTLVVPLTLPERVAIGAVDFETSGEEAKDEDTLRIIEAVTTQAAQAIEAIRLFEQTQAAREEAETLYSVGSALVAAQSEEEMFHTVLQETLSTLGLKQGGILFLEPDRKFGKLVALFRDGQAVEPDLRIPVEGNPSYAKLITTKRPVAIVDFASDPLVAPVRAINPSHQIASLLLVPIIIDDEVIGAIGADAVQQKHNFTDREINLVRAIADQLSITLQNRRLLEETRQRAIELQETAERLQEMDKLKTQFLANMSHELRTPLNSIIGFSRVILKGIDGPLTELQKTDLTSIYNSGQHLLGLINNVLDLSKIEAGKMELNFEEVEIGPVIKGVMSTAIALVKDKPVELVQEMPDNLPTVWADATRLRQIILNLVSNACKFTEEGSVTVLATAKREKIIIRVSDTGMGIPSDNMEHIFEEFTQVDASTTRKVGGTGLGLPISRHFVEMHKGQIWVDSTPGQGSTFSFAIPINPISEISETTDDRTATNGKPSQGKTIVAIDDDPGVINLYKRFLEKRNYNIVAINNAKDVVARVKADAPSAILLDILMPDKDGWQVLKELKQDILTKDIPVIICSIISDKNKGFDLGAADYLTKPIVESELVNALKHIDEQQKEQIKVLVIDDKADDILLIRRMLEAHNYQIIEASNGKDGLDLVQSRTPDLIILDLSMPEMDGFAVVEALKIDEDTRDIPIVIVSAKQPTQAEHESLTGQVEVLLHKGIFTESELVQVVSQALEKLDTNPEPW
jgi:signal transduction histidine kinase/CheY-like chemotaxis protein